MVDDYYRCLHCDGILWFMFFGEESWSHEDGELDKDHKAEPNEDYNA